MTVSSLGDTSGRQRAFYSAIRKRLAEMWHFNDRGFREIGDGARHLQDTMMAPRGETETLHGLFQQMKRVGLQRTEVVDLPRCQRQIQFARAQRLCVTYGHHARIVVGV